jgi:hypothetical protein
MLVANFGHSACAIKRYLQTTQASCLKATIQRRGMLPDARCPAGTWTLPDLGKQEIARP